MSQSVSRFDGQICYGTCPCGTAAQLFKTGKCAHCYIADLERLVDDRIARVYDLTHNPDGSIKVASEKAAQEDRALNLLRGLHKVVLDLAPHFEKPITDDNVARWLALNSAQAAAKEFLDAVNR